MEIVRQFRCMRCGNEYEAIHTKDGQLVERSCPKCRSNSIRLMKENKKAGGSAAKK
ncbi:hypothetical protein ACFL6M_00650 [Candidatus Eisenbacteria bacterium]|uniref:Zinc ribbon domain-containing protein n=1 Tax=Eiseniibacteriota bacterium TaxID=2212470 RepID=A0ABV6YIZ4_UNCEI